MSDWQKIDNQKYPNFKCPKCKNNDNLHYYIWESYDGAYEDYHYVCDDCNYDWWVESADY